MNVLVYHGSPNVFKQFNFEHIGTEGGIDGAGFGMYFSESEEDAKQYGPNIYTCFLQLENNVSNTNITIPIQTLYSMLEMVLETEGVSYYDKYTSDPFLTKEEKVYQLKKMLSTFKSDTELIADIINHCYDGDINGMMEILSIYCFTHTIDKETPTDKTITHYIVYDLDTIMIQDVKNIESN